MAYPLVGPALWDGRLQAELRPLPSTRIRDGWVAYRYVPPMLTHSNRVLVVVAHPDDEVLGCGGTIARLTAAGTSVRVCFLAGSADARTRHPGAQELRCSAERAQQSLGADSAIFGPFPNIQLNAVPHLELVQFVEEALKETRASTVFTHHPQDLNVDHRETSAACRAAVRLAQRGESIPPLQSFHMMEVLSATDWALAPPGSSFHPTTYVEIGSKGIDAKLRALKQYDGVIRPYPHPRSTASINALATLRGSDSGLYLAEAFETAFLNWRI